MPKMPGWTKSFFRAAIYTPGDADALAHASAEAAFAARALRLKRGAKVLDLCCGTGRHSLALARRGALVTGLDATPEYLREARRRSRGASNPVFIKGDMRRLAFQEEFDAVINLWTSFGYFDDPEDDLRVLHGVREALKPGGLFLIDLVDFDWNRRFASPRGWFRRSDGTVVLEEIEMREGRDPGLANTWTVLSPGKPEARARFFVRGYDKRRLCAVLERAGLVVEKIWGGLQGEKRTKDSRRLAILSRRPRRSASS